MNYLDIWFPDATVIHSFSQTITIAGILATLAVCVVYILFSIRHLILIFQNRDKSLTQNMYILFKLLTMVIASYVIYIIVSTIIEVY